MATHNLGLCPMRVSKHLSGTGTVFVCLCVCMFVCLCVCACQNDKSTVIM